MWDLALLIQPLRICMEERWEMAGLFSIQPLYSGACKIQLYRGSPAQGAAGGGGLDLEVLGKLVSLDGRGGCPFPVPSPLHILSEA